VRKRAIEGGRSRERGREKEREEKRKSFKKTSNLKAGNFKEILFKKY
jgi:hypothetical protein